VEDECPAGVSPLGLRARFPVVGKDAEVDGLISSYTQLASVYGFSRW
jgi:hypothetical protein